MQSRKLRTLLGVALFIFLLGSCERRQDSAGQKGYVPSLRTVFSSPRALPSVSPMISPIASLASLPSPRPTSGSRSNRAREDLLGVIDQKRIELNQVQERMSDLQSEIAQASDGDHEPSGRSAAQATEQKIEMEGRKIQWQVYLGSLSTQVQAQRAVVQSLELQERYWSSLNFDSDGLRAVKSRLEFEFPQLADLQRQLASDQVQARLDSAFQSSQADWAAQSRLLEVQQESEQRLKDQKAALDQFQAQAQRIRTEGRQAEQELTQAAN